MSEDWREELIDKMVRSMWYVEPDNNTLMLNDLARAALAVAEPVIREWCAKMADITPYAFDAGKDMNTIAAAIRETGE